MSFQRIPQESKQLRPRISICARITRGCTAVCKAPWRQPLRRGHKWNTYDVTCFRIFEMNTPVCVTCARESLKQNVASDIRRSHLIVET
jgi:hypothetical protein